MVAFPLGRKRPRAAKLTKRGEPGTPLRIKLLTWFVATIVSVVLALGMVGMYAAVRFGPRAVTKLVKTVVPVELPSWIPLP